MQIEFRKLVAPLGVQLELTPFCSNNCFHCYNYWRDENSIPKESMTEEGFLQVGDALSSSSVFYVTITGGEPFSVKPLFLKVLQKLSSQGIYCDLNSNLTDIDGESTDVMKACGLRSILTSFHSFREGVHDAITNRPGSFRKTLANIRKLAEAGFVVSANMVVTKKNFRDVYETGRFLKEAGAKGFNATRLQDPVRGVDFSPAKLTEEETRFVLEQLLSAGNDFSIDVGSVVPYPFCFLAEDKRFLQFPRRMCGAGITAASIEYSGSVRACPNSELCYGNIITEGLSECWQRMSEWREGVYIPSECSGCYYLATCKGGCRAEGMKAGKMNQPDALMTSPIKSRVEGLLPEDKREYSLGDVLVICDRLRYRREDFGYTLVGHKPTFPAFVSDVVLKTLLRLRNKGKALVNDFVSEWGVALADVVELLSYLEERGVVTRIT